MKFAFLRSLNFENFKTTFLRFPLSILSGAVASWCAVYMSYGAYDGFPQEVTQLWASSFVGILLFTGLALFAERMRLRSWLIQLVGIPVLYFLIYCADFDHEMVSALRVALVFLSSLALIFSGPYALTREDKGFWLFFVKVWNRAMFAIATAIITVIALSLALVSIENLFEVTVDSRWYEYLYAIFLVFIPNVVFLMGMPGDFKKLEKETPAFSFRALGTYLFLPLLSIYFLILATYVVKILATQVWPDGFVAMPIIIFSAIGFGMYALIFPLLQEKGNRLLQFMSRVSLWSLPVFTVVYFIAFWQRIEQYGLTEMRYLGVALGVLILAWSLYFGWAKNPRLKAIPVGLFVVPFLLSFGPWGVFQVTQCSQISRLENLLEKNGLLAEGVLVPSSDEVVGQEARQEISSTLDYLVDNYGAEVVDGIFEAGEYSSASGLMEQLGISYESMYGYLPEDGGKDYYFGANDMDAQLLDGYQYQMHYYFYDSAPLGGGGSADATLNDLTYTVGKKELTFHYNTTANALEVSGAGTTLSIPMTDFLAGLEAEHPEQSPLPREDFVISGSNGSLALKVYFTSISYRRVDGETVYLSLDGDVLVKLK